VFALTTQHIVAFTTAQIAGLTSDQLDHMSSHQAIAFESQDIGAMSMDQLLGMATHLTYLSGGQILAMDGKSPLVLDLAGTGIQTTSAAHGVNFDLMGTGTAQLTGWVTSTEGLLAVDRNHDGKINDGTELFGSATRLANGQMAGDGFTALKEFDSNHDGKVSAADANWKDLKVWVDLDHDGVTDAGELKSLEDVGVVSMSLNFNYSSQTSNGNLLGMISSYTSADGKEHQMIDVWFKQGSSSGAASGGTAAGSTASAGALTSDTAQADTNAAAPAAGTEHGKSGGTQGALPVGLGDLLAPPSTDLLGQGGAGGSGTPPNLPPGHRSVGLPQDPLLGLRRNQDDDDLLKPLI